MGQATGKADGDAVFYVPEKPNKIFRREFEDVGIDYKNQTTGCYFDCHSLRHGTDTYLSDAGVLPSVVMRFMRSQDCAG